MIGWNGRLVTTSGSGFLHTSSNTYGGSKRFARFGDGVDDDVRFGSFFGYGHDCQLFLRR
jgi:hypothetical protein